MKFSCDRSLLMSALNTVTKALTQRSNIPVLEGILLTAEGRQVTLACTDMSLTIEADIAYGCTQAELAKRSQVSLRSIQMYEQRNKDINKASAETVLRLSRVLGCTMEDLLEK